MRRMARKNLHRNAWGDRLPAIEQSHLPTFDQSIIILGNKADGIALARMLGILPLAPGRVILGPGKGRYNLPVLIPHRVPSAMIEMQMGINHDVDILGHDPARGEIVEQLRRLTVELPHPLRKLVAHPGLDQYRLSPSADQQ